MLNFFNRLLNNEKGFTLIEVLVVVAIIGILTALAVPMVIGRINDAREQSDVALLESCEKALAAYLLDSAIDPTTHPVDSATGFPADLTWLDAEYLEQDDLSVSGNRVNGILKDVEYTPATGKFTLVPKVAAPAS